MLKLMTAVAALALLAGSANAQSAKPDTRNASNAFKRLSQAECTGDKGAAWKDSETWTRKSDGKERVTQARCSFDAKSGKVLVAKMLAGASR